MADNLQDGPSPSKHRSSDDQVNYPHVRVISVVLSRTGGNGYILTLIKADI